MCLSPEFDCIYTNVLPNWLHSPYDFDSLYFKWTTSIFSVQIQFTIRKHILSHGPLLRPTILSHTLVKSGPKHLNTSLLGTLPLSRVSSTQGYVLFGIITSHHVDYGCGSVVHTDRANYRLDEDTLILWVGTIFWCWILISEWSHLQKRVTVESVSTEWATIYVGCGVWWYVTILNPTSIKSGSEHLNISLLGTFPLLADFQGWVLLKGM